jgi:DNA-binding NtrC family response regulator
VVVICATNRSLSQMVEQGTFRRDLHARLSSARVELPPLRDRREDIYAIAEHASAKVRAWEHANVEVEAVERLLLHPWMSNVRELVTSIEQVLAINPRPELRLWAVDRVLGPMPYSVRTLTKQMVEDALTREKGNESAAARALGITRGKLRRFLAERK